MLAKRNDVAALKWLLDRGADPNARWGHWDAEVTALHLAASQGHAEAVRLLLAAGADPHIRDSKHDGDAIGWAEYFQHPEIVRLLQANAAKP
jgi:glutaminase